MLKWSIPIGLAVLILLVCAFTTGVDAQNWVEKGINTLVNRPSVVAIDQSQSAVAIAASANITSPKGKILRERGIPGKGVDTAPGLQKPFNPKSKAAYKNGGPNQFG